MLRTTALGWILLPIAVAAAGTFYLFQQPADAVIDFEGRYENGFISGFHGPERDAARGFRWTSGRSYIELHNLPPGEQEIEARLKVIRPPGEDLPMLWFTANEVTVYRTAGLAGEATYRFTVPLRGSSLRLGIHSDTFTAAGSRTLGVQALSVRIRSPEGRSGIYRPTLWMMVAALILLATFRAAGLSKTVSTLIATAFSAAFVYLLAQASVRFSGYPVEVAGLAGIILVSSVILRRLLRWSGWFHPSEEPLVIGLLAATLLLKLGALTYPLMAISDAQFHANRLSELLQGDFFITSVSQHAPPFRIPYPVSLYVLAAPWAAMGLDKVTTLKVLTAIADVSIGFVLILWARRFLGSTRTGVLAAAVYQLVPLNFLAFSAGNFTNLFGVATTVIFLALLIAAGGGAGAFIGALIFSSLALTSHFGTFLFDIMLWPACLAGIYWLVPPGLKARNRRAMWIAVAASVAAALVYYAGYWELFTSQWQRVLTRDYASGTAEVAGPMTKLAFNLSFWREQLGIVFALLAFLGAVPILRRSSASPFHVTAAAWTVVAFLFLLLDLTTALEVRYLLQTLPLLALFAGNYLSGAFERGRAGKLAAIVALGYLAATGLLNLRECLLYRYH